MAENGKLRRFGLGFELLDRPCLVCTKLEVDTGIPVQGDQYFLEAVLRAIGIDATEAPNLAAYIFEDRHAHPETRLINTLRLCEECADREMMPVPISDIADMRAGTPIPGIIQP